MTYTEPLVGAATTNVKEVTKKTFGRAKRVQSEG